jgi:hypothetical protein
MIALSRFFSVGANQDLVWESRPRGIVHPVAHSRSVFGGWETQPIGLPPSGGSWTRHSLESLAKERNVVGVYSGNFPSRDRPDG